MKQPEQKELRDGIAAIDDEAYNASIADDKAEVQRLLAKIREKETGYETAAGKSIFNLVKKAVSKGDKTSTVVATEIGKKEEDIVTLVSIRSVAGWMKGSDGKPRVDKAGKPMGKIQFTWNPATKMIGLPSKAA
jgi:hypothetical protein